MKKISLYLMSGYFFSFSLMMFATTIYTMCHKDTCAISLDEKTIIALLTSGILLLITAVGLLLKQDFARKLALMLSGLLLLLAPVSVLWANASLPLTIMPKYIFYSIVFILQIVIPLILISFLIKPTIKTFFSPLPFSLNQVCPFIPSIINKSRYSILLCLISILFFVQMAFNIFLLSEIGVKEIFFAGIVFNDSNAFILVQAMIILGFIASAGIYKQSKLGWLAGISLNGIMVVSAILNIIFITPEQASIMMPPFPLLEGQTINITEILIEYRRQMAAQILIPGSLLIYLFMKRSLFVNPFIEKGKKI